MWTRVMYPEGGFGKGWQGRPASTEETPYEIDTSSGAVRRQDGLHGGHVQANTLPAGYRQILLRVPKRTNLMVHNLVCWVAHGPRPPGKTSVDHGDRDKSHNDKDNVSWASHSEQNMNRQFKGGRIPTLPFDPKDDEVLYDFRGLRSVEYTGTKLQFTSHGRIVRGGRVTPIKITPGQYPRIAVTGLGEKQWYLVHVLVWSAFYGPHAEVPKVINHRDQDKTNFKPGNLEDSSKSHNAIAAHDGGRYDHARSKRQRICVVDAVDGGIVGEYESQTDAIRNLSAHKSNVWRSLANSTRTFKGTVDGIPRSLKAIRM